MPESGARGKEVVPTPKPYQKKEKRVEKRK